MPANESDSRLARKRIQNRISQQHAREKQIAHVRELESFVNAIKSSIDKEGSQRDENNTEIRHDKIVKAYLDVMKENSKLKEGLLRMRKKMLVLSDQAGTGASDAVFDEIFGKPEQRALSPELMESLSSTASKPQNCSTQIFEPQRTDDIRESCGSSRDMAIRDTIDHPPSLGTGRGQETDINLDVNGLSLPKTLYESQKYPTVFNGLGENVSEAYNGPNLPRAPGSHTHVSEFPLHDSGHGSFGEMMTNESILDTQRFQAPSISFDEDLISQLYNRRTLVMQNDFGNLDFMYHPGFATSTHCSSSVFEVIENVLSVYISQLEQITDAVWKKLSSAAARLLFSWTRMDDFVHCLGLEDLHESVIRWRLEPNATNRSAIREPFRPTELQSIVIITAKYSPWLDFIPWPELRDQVLLRKGLIDPAKVLQDILDNLVLELPNLGVAVSKSALFVATRRKIVKNYRISQGCYVDADESNEAPDNPLPIHTDFTPKELSLQPAALMAQMKDEMDTATSNDIGARAKTTRAALNPELLQMLTVEFTEKYSIKDISKWRVGPAMGVTYPFMHIASIVTSFPIISASVVVGR